MKLTQASITLLAAIIAATDANGENTACGYVAASYPAGKALIENNLIELNETMKNDAGETAARPTAIGREYAKTGMIAGSEAGADAGTAGTSGAVDSQKAPVARKSFAIDDAVPLPPKTRAPVEQLYPFDQLQVGQSFFVANDDVKSGAAYKTLQSTVNSANGRYSEETGETRPNKRDPSKQVPVTKATRKFELRHAEHDGKQGARVFRVALTAE